jgi:hypothetical protein
MDAIKKYDTKYIHFQDNTNQINYDVLLPILEIVMYLSTHIFNLVRKVVNSEYKHDFIKIKTTTAKKSNTKSENGTYVFKIFGMSRNCLEISSQKNFVSKYFFCQY